LKKLTPLRFEAGLIIILVDLVSIGIGAVIAIILLFVGIRLAKRERKKNRQQSNKDLADALNAQSRIKNGEGKVVYRENKMGTEHQKSVKENLNLGENVVVKVTEDKNAIPKFVSRKLKDHKTDALISDPNSEEDKKKEKNKK